eukprot:gene1231-4440_t
MPKYSTADHRPICRPVHPAVESHVCGYWHSRAATRVCTRFTSEPQPQAQTQAQTQPRPNCLLQPTHRRSPLLSCGSPHTTLLLVKLFVSLSVYWKTWDIIRFGTLTHANSVQALDNAESVVTVTVLSASMESIFVVNASDNMQRTLVSKSLTKCTRTADRQAPLILCRV